VGDAKVRLRRLIRKYTESNSEMIGDQSQDKIVYPIDFFGAISNPEDVFEISLLIQSIISDLCQDLSANLHFDLIACPFTSNQSIVFEIGKRLGKSSLLVNQNHTLFREQRIFGAYKPGMKVLFVHDIVYSGKRIRNCIISLRACGLIVEHVVALVERTDEGACGAKCLQDLNVILHPFDRLNSNDIEKIIQSGHGV